MRNQGWWNCLIVAVIDPQAIVAKEVRKGEHNRQQAPLEIRPMDGQRMQI
jgi:hypothetical protein